MIEKTLKTTSGKLRVSIPTQLNEVTLGQMMDLQQTSDLNDIDAISILSGIPVDQLKTVLDFNDFLLFGNVVQSLSHQIAQLYNSDIIPDLINFPTNKITVKVMKNLSIEPVGAFMASREIIADEISECIKTYGEENWQDYFNPSLKACCQLLAHYFYCKATGKPYNEYEAEEFTAEIKKLRVMEALPIAKHFFICYPNLSKQKISFWQRLRRLWKKKPASAHSKNLNTSTL
ncbi:hypothetical protein HDF19_21745 [Mucilaginibacter sp. E4BP6]|uniref:hypothetical protein n=1 Tax=Mucilaginibacter sp. E4BP6 TaxID=2723089 RepID=UPI0015CCDD1E|nr:hypothetical protein [Mucilaginibacter sp. E4BP6]NYE67964.1 hypothetical protein [Mucilaginibacter sp. E4BP6]